MRVDGDPFAIGDGTVVRVVWSQDLGVVGRVGAVALVGDVLGFLGVGRAVRLVIGQESNVFPWRRSPVRIVVTFFGTFVTESVTIVVLTSEDRRSTTRSQTTFISTVGNPKELVRIEFDDTKKM